MTLQHAVFEFKQAKTQKWLRIITIPLTTLQVRKTLKIYTVIVDVCHALTVVYWFLQSLVRLHAPGPNLLLISSFKVLRIPNKS